MYYSKVLFIMVIFETPNVIIEDTFK